jgi:hypothetical protein
MASTAPKPFVFVLMPFDASFNDAYELGIKPACESAGAYCERLDEQIFHENMLERIYNQISKADIIVSDMTERNPNVFYETGYAHALNKLVVMLTKDAKDIPFDLKHYPHIIYGTSIVSLKDELQRRIEYFLANPETPPPVSIDELEYFVNGNPVALHAYIDLLINDHQRNIGWTISVGVRNKGQRVLQLSDIRFALVWPVAMANPLVAVGNYSKIKADTYMMDISDQFLNLLPEAWMQKSVQLINQELHETFDEFTQPVKQRRVAPDNPLLKVFGQTYQCVIRTFTPSGMREVPFTFSVK